MSFDVYEAARSSLDPDTGEVETAEVIVEDDVLVKAFALGPDAALEPHEHAGSTNVFHVLEGTLTVIRDGERERVEAPGAVLHERGVAHGAENDTEETVVFTASLCPLPG